VTDLAISVEGLHKSYGSNEAVAGVDLAVGHGEVFALLGPNGAGKTTTVEILEGFRKRDTGSVTVLGEDPAHAHAAWRQRIGIVLQGTGEFDELTVGEVVRHFARFYRNAADPAEVIERVGLSEKVKARTHTLSGGQKRRLDVALGIVNQPELLFLDEPTTGFDPAARREFWKVIDDLAHKGTTILLTTHYLEEAEVLADRVGVINRGKLIEVSTPAELGGRNKARATVSWRDGREETDEPTVVVQRLAAQYEGEIPELTVKRPTLEDIYLKMIGER
jgi:ABC-2 type transport system ATP-binding protein